MDDKIWDVIVVGGGPAGMMSAGRAAELGAKVLLIEKNQTLGKKLLITGGGRCNLTNAEFDNRKLLEKYKDSGKFLFSTFSQWSVKETLDFFHKKGMETRTEPGDRVFPATDKAESVFIIMKEYIENNGVKILSNSPVENLSTENKQIIGIQLQNGKIIKANSVIIATGGLSHPETGSTGDAFKWLKKIGHTIVTPESSLVPLLSPDKWVKKLSGVSIENIKITPYVDGVKQNNSKKGKILFTHFGLSGPTILNMSKKIGELLKQGAVTLSLDFLPELDFSKINTLLQEIFKNNDKKKFKNCLDSILPSSIVPIIVELSGIEPDKQCNSITREERVVLMNLLKNVPVNIDGLLGTEKAIVTSGGIPLQEIDPKTMQSLLFSNLYLVGDVLDVNRPSGGFSLQLCWTTGFVAGSSSAKSK